ncbi:MAG TPA: thioester reductase domain-containing protein, partial [Streptosporangiaceae bacterium]|nr:thioester reductase domain-containing protein [Streptosporangiaceae bacterium]
LAPGHAEPPATPAEHQVAAIFTAILDRDHISRDDNFFALGGTSIQAARAVLLLRSDVGVEVDLGTFYAAPAVADIAQAVEHARTAAAAQDDGQAAEIAELERRLAQARGEARGQVTAAVTPALPPDGALPPRAGRRHAEILLTGATGFFGAFLLEELLTRTSGVVHCLVRAATDAEGERRLRDNLRRYGREYVAQDPRVRVVRGDLKRPRLGLAEAGYAALASRLDTIVHAGAHVDLLLPYSGLEPANVGGTRSVIELATAGALKEVHLVSSVSAAMGAGLDPGSFGYAVTKWRAELIAQAARDRGVPIAIYRMPRLSGDSRTGVSNGNDVVVRLVRSFQQMGLAPEVTAVEEWIPVNFAARTMIDTALSHPDGGLFVLQPRGQVEIRRLIEFAAQTSPLVVKPPGEFIADASQRFPEAAELIGFVLGKSVAGYVVDDAGIGPFESVPADGVSDDLLRRYLHMWAPEAGELS